MEDKIRALSEQLFRAEDTDIIELVAVELQAAVRAYVDRAKESITSLHLSEVQAARLRN